jgi:hypothetical protein
VAEENEKNLVSPDRTERDSQDVIRREASIIMGRRNIGYWIRAQLNEMDRSCEWLYRKTGIATGSINRWCKGSEPSTSTFISICWAFSKAQNKPIWDVFIDYIEYISTEVE